MHVIVHKQVARARAGCSEVQCPGVPTGYLLGTPSTTWRESVFARYQYSRTHCASSGVALLQRHTRVDRPRTCAACCPASARYLDQRCVLQQLSAQGAHLLLRAIGSCKR